MLGAFLQFCNNTWVFVAIALGCLPTVAAMSEHDPFPDIPFKLFSQFILDNFHSSITLSTVLMLLFTMTENPDLLNLHARQQNPCYSGEHATKISGWIKALARGVEKKLGDNVKSLFQDDKQPSMTAEGITNGIGKKLDIFSKVLKLYPYEKSQFQQKLKPISQREIEPVYMLCPEAMACEVMQCNPRCLQQSTRDRDIPQVTLIKGTRIYECAYVLTGKCPACQTSYHADHERARQAGNDNWSRVYINSAKYLKVGQNMWVDRVFSGAVLNGMYSFHASSAAFSEFWNDSFWQTQCGDSPKVSRRQIWHTFVQESVRTIASVSNINLELENGLPIKEVTNQAFRILGEKGVIRSADNHSCAECTHQYKRTADIITEDDPAAIVGVDENRAVPELMGDDADLAVRDAARARARARAARNEAADEDMDIDSAPVKMVVLDGIVMGHTVSYNKLTKIKMILTTYSSLQHCSYDNCTSDLANARGGVFCAEHELLHGDMCRMRDCQNIKVAGTQTCQRHQGIWYNHVVRHGRQSLLGVRRLLRQTEDENLPWLANAPGVRRAQPHDEPAPAVPRNTNYFIAPRFYCVETICAPCGVVLAWAKFAKSESPTQILNFLQQVFPTEESRPAYVCIDKACMLLRTSISNGSWEMWKQTTRFIVDSYHYINHRTTDYLCRKWCNPAPLNGSAPNLVVVERDREGRQHYKHAFNTQVCICLLSLLNFCN